MAVSVLWKRRETEEEARQRRLCRFMLGLPPETVYCHVREGVATAVGLCVVLLLVIAWQLGHLATLAPALAGGALIALLTPTVLMIRHHYRHVAAGGLVLALMLGLLAVAVHRYGNPVTIAFIVSPTPSAMADSASPQ
jgi:hypothetical protein